MDKAKLKIRLVCKDDVMGYSEYGDSEDSPYMESYIRNGFKNHF